MREYVEHRAGDPARRRPPPEGEKWQTGFALSGLEPRPDAAASSSPPCRRAMLRLAGEIADGVILWLCNPDYIRDVVVPEVARRARAGGPIARRVRRSSPPCPAR